MDDYNNYWLSDLGDCDICGKGLVEESVFYDARTRNGIWAIMCKECFKKLTDNILGIGSGQEYDTITKKCLRGLEEVLIEA